MASAVEAVSELGDLLVELACAPGVQRRDAREHDGDQGGGEPHARMLVGTRQPGPHQGAPPPLAPRGPRYPSGTRRNLLEYLAAGALMAWAGAFLLRSRGAVGREGGRRPDRAWSSKAGCALDHHVHIELAFYQGLISPKVDDLLLFIHRGALLRVGRVAPHEGVRFWS